MVIVDKRGPVNTTEAKKGDVFDFLSPEGKHRFLMLVYVGYWNFVTVDDGNWETGSEHKSVSDLFQYVQRHGGVLTPVKAVITIES